VSPAVDMYCCCTCSCLHHCPSCRLFQVVPAGGRHQDVTGVAGAARTAAVSGSLQQTPSPEAARYRASASGHFGGTPQPAGWAQFGSACKIAHVRMLAWALHTATQQWVQLTPTAIPTAYKHVTRLHCICTSKPDDLFILLLLG
jgi:hypothetical protein